MTTAVHATVTRKNEGTALWVLGSLFEIKATGHDTGGHLTVVEMTFAPGKPAAPPHRHNSGEAVYVLEGTVRYHVDDQAFDAMPGDFLYFPEGALEWMENPTTTPARALVMYDRAGIEDFFNEVGEKATTRTLPSAPPAPDFDALAAAAKRHGLELHRPTA
jgi:quercetin dioxygenase-like cupin family protein